MQVGYKIAVIEDDSILLFKPLPTLSESYNGY